MNTNLTHYLWVVTKLEHRCWSSWLWNPPRTNRHWAAAFNSVQYLHIISFNKIIIFNKKTKTTKPCGSREARIIVIKCEILRKPETEPVCWSFTKRRACLRWWLTSLALTVLYLPVKASEWLSSWLRNSKCAICAYFHSALVSFCNNEHFHFSMLSFFGNKLRQEKKLRGKTKKPDRKLPHCLLRIIDEEFFW